MSKIWLTSDTHYSHKNTLRYCGRPFFTIKQCDDAMIERWNTVVKPEDTVYHFGDVAMHTAPMKRILPQLNGKKILIVGNHDLVYPYFLKTRGQKFIDKMMKEYTEAGFSEILPSGTIRHLTGSNGFNVKARLSHFPTKNAFDSYHNDKHDAMRPIDNGNLNICGHIHIGWLKHGNNINVGVDVFDFTPVSLDTVIKLWTDGPTNVETPKKWRIAIWKLYHTAVWKINKLLERKNPNVKK